jgi:16S rRNA (uracil1498-N3)-methyltransferase
VTKHDFTSKRLFVDAPMAQNATVDLPKESVHYLLTVLRLTDGATLKVFNGRDGEWLAEVEQQGRKSAVLHLRDQTQTQPQTASVDYIFAPLKAARLDYIVQKAVEMGATRLCPVITQFTQVTRLNLDRMRANVIEAAEQCGILTIPEVCEEISLLSLLHTWTPSAPLLFCDEDAESDGPLAKLQTTKSGPFGVLIGPEGGFSEQEREEILRIPSVIRLSLGPRILRADTAGVAALALAQATLGDWPRK